MSPSPQEPRAGSDTPEFPQTSPQRRRGRAGIVLVLIASLLASAATREWADNRRQAAIPNRGESGAGTSLSNMNSFALGLLLGGLRGPLVMILWTESESQKSAKNLEGVDTQIEWIRLLQPEFDTVHIFQIWNKAYNISVQMASKANKYSVILDALSYAASVDHDKPDDINILAAIGQIYFDKLGNSSEKLYYKNRIRKETQAHPVSRRQGSQSRQVRMDPLLDEQFRLLPALIQPAPGRERPADLPSNQEWNDGAPLQYLAAFSTFPDGVPPMALAYNYFKRAEVLQNVGKQRHAQMSAKVIDSRPPLALKAWSEDEWEQGRRRELQAFNMAAPDDRVDLEPVDADLSPDHAVLDPAAARLAVFAYDRATDLAIRSTAEYVRHIRNDPADVELYKSYMDDLQAEPDLCAGDSDYLKAILAAPADRPALLASAAEHYRQAIHKYEIIILKYYADPAEVMRRLPAGFGRDKTADHAGLSDLSPAQADQILSGVAQALGNRQDGHEDDRKEYLGYIRRAAVRLRYIH